MWPPLWTLLLDVAPIGDTSICVKYTKKGMSTVTYHISQKEVTLVIHSKNDAFYGKIDLYTKLYTLSTEFSAYFEKILW